MVELMFDIATIAPAVLVLSLPRSGSSWAGEALGCAIDALYLREPITQSDRLFHRLGTVSSIEEPDLTARYQRLADKAFAGLTWEAGAERFVAERTRNVDASNPWDTSRNSREMSHRWLGHTVSAHVAARRRTFGAFDLPWYREDGDWPMPQLQSAQC